MTTSPERWLSGVLVLMIAACAGQAEPPGEDTEGTSDGPSVTTSADESADAGSTTAIPGGSSETADPSETGTGGDALEGSCPGVELLPRPVDTAERGPWAVGARTVEIDGLTVEVWYPAQDPGAGLEPEIYDIRESLPPSEQVKISDEDNPWQACDCYRDLPIDDAHGPYPVILFVHGTAGFRTQSLPQMVHWASRGFVVMAADHPGLWLADLLGIACGNGMVPQDIGGDLATMLAAVRGEVGGLEDFGDRLDPDRIGTAGHSAGGNAVSTTGDESAVVVPMAARGVADGSMLASTLILGALEDSVVPFSNQLDGYDSSPRPKRLVGIANTGHLAFSEICALHNAAGDDLVEIAQANDVCGAGFANGLFQCDDSFTPDPVSWDIIHFASSAVLEETLHCEPEAAAGLGEIQRHYPEVQEFREDR